MTSALDRVRSRKKRASARVPMCMDAALTAEVDRLTDLINKARMRTALPGGRNDDNLAVEIASLEDALADAKAAVAEATEWFLVEALPPHECDALIDKHPPTKEQVAQARKENGPKATLRWNSDTFTPALIAACTSVITPDGEDPDTGRKLETYEHLTPEFVDEMMDGGLWSTGEMLALFEAALDVNSSRASVTSAGNG